MNNLGTLPHLPFGVNLIGYPFSILGLGTDLRTAARTLAAANIPFCVIETPQDTPSTKSDFEFIHAVSLTPKFNITIICLPCSDLYRCFLLFGDAFFAGQYIIGQMQWEFSSWPSLLTPVLGILDEAWAMTQFIHDSLSPVFTKHIERMPRAIDYTSHFPVARDYFTIPPEAFVFLFVYDGLSTAQRKNPFAVLEAFIFAFNEKKTNAYLVIKVMNAKYDLITQQFLDYSKKNENIIIVQGALQKEIFFSLYNCCDVYVSLHRSEGFGLTIAEAMACGKPVIVSDYSGSKDFCLPTNSFLVGGKEIPVEKNDYFLAGNQVWFDPDVHEAAHWMKYCYENRSEAIEKGKAAEAIIKNKYSIDTVAKHYHTRLTQIAACMT